MQRDEGRAARRRRSRGGRGAAWRATGTVAAVVLAAAALLAWPAVRGTAPVHAGPAPGGGIQVFQAEQTDWTPPDGVTSVMVELWGGGGGGGCSGGSSGKGGGGGGAGGYIRAFVPVSSGFAYTVVVSPPAAGCSGSGLAQPGSRTALLEKKSVLVAALGGRPGTNGTSTAQGQGGFGGNTVNNGGTSALAWSGGRGQNAFGNGYSGDGGEPTPGSVGMGFGSGGRGGGRLYLPWALDSTIRNGAGYGDLGYAIITWWP